ncbi:hypothetical protein [Plantactinospora sonchi]|uniref:Swt1-like HEPN domain-containing protein n=1 Tax=Plantactinospora sonchi TaxID=1544735 RepID=A0ABU7RP12_9ACTN
MHRVEWESAAQRGWDHAFPPLADLGQGSVVLLWHPETVAHRRDFEDVLRQSRPKGQEAIAAGTRLMVVSARPKLSFPEPDGSSIIADCSRLRPISLDADLLRSMCPDLKPAAAERILRFAGGTVALAEYYLELEFAELSGNEKLRRAGQFLRAVLLRAVDELGVGTLALLDHLVLESDMLDLPADNLADHQIAALESARLLRVNDLDGTVHLFAEPWRAEVKECLASALRSVVSPPADWEVLARKMFTFERTVRRMVMEVLREVHGDAWREALGDRGAKAFGLARNDTHVSASSLNEMYTPLDWFLLEDLLDLAAELAMAHGTVRGVRAGEWARLKVQMVPIRNRVAHMRLPLETDAAAVRSALLNLDARMRSFERATA